jgi:hypothetical protein
VSTVGQLGLGFGIFAQ